MFAGLDLDEPDTGVGLGVLVGGNGVGVEGVGTVEVGNGVLVGSGDGFAAVVAWTAASMVCAILGVGAGGTVGLGCEIADGVRVGVGAEVTVGVGTGVGVEVGVVGRAVCRSGDVVEQATNINASRNIEGRMMYLPSVRFNLARLQHCPKPNPPGGPTSPRAWSHTGFV